MYRGLQRRRGWILALGAMTALFLSLAPAAGAANSLFWSNYEPNSLGRANLDGSGAVTLPFPGVLERGAYGTAIDSAAGRIYWTENRPPPGRISFANLDGSGGGTLNVTGASPGRYSGLAIDPVGGRIYFGQADLNKISFANLNGTGGGDLNTAGATVNQPFSVTVDRISGRVYWTNLAGEQGISFANLDGSGGGGNLDTSGTTLNDPLGVAIDHSRGRVYWANRENNIISFASLNGSGGDDLPTAGAPLASPSGVAIDAAAGRIYWANETGASIGFANLAGGGGGSLPTAGAAITHPNHPVLFKAPLGTGAPTIAGKKVPGAPLSCSAGSWAADELGAFLYQVPQSFAFQWSKAGKLVPGATKTRFTPRRGGSYACTVTATNGAGSAAQAATVKVKAATIKLGKVTPNGEKGTARIAIRVSVPGKVTVAGKGLVKASKAARKAGVVRLTVKAKGDALGQLARAGSVKLKAVVTLAPKGAAKTVRRIFVLLKQG